MRSRNLIGMLCCLVAAVTSLHAAILRVGPSGDYPTIADALAAAAPFDELRVAPGLYREWDLRVNKPLKITAEAGAVVDAGGEPYDIFLVTADCVEISGFELRNVGVSYRYECAAVRLREIDFAEVYDNTILNCFFGIYLENVAHVRVSGNRVESSFTDEASAGNAIHAWKCRELRITDNVARGHRDGIYFEFVDDSRIVGNESYTNLRYGLHFMFSNRDVYRGNTFRDNAAGVAVMFSRNIEMTGNAFLQNWGGASYGLLLKEISDGRIAGNRFVRNTTGILAEGANRLEMTGNQFTRNGTAIDVKGNSLDNLVAENNFLANTFEVVTNSKYSNNRFTANYWSGYRGYDLDRDGVGDVPYRPVNFFAKITREIPAATLLLHSSVVDLLEIGEKNFPLLIPAELIDSFPRLTPYPYDRD